MLGALVAGLGHQGVTLAANDRAAPNSIGPAAAQLRNLVRMQGSLTEEDVPWWFTGVIFAVTGHNATPQPLVRFEGMEVYWFQHKPNGYFLGGHTVTFFRDYATNEFLYEFKNPWTGKIDAVKPAVQGGSLGFAYTEQGIWPARYSGEPLGPVPNTPLRLQWHEVGEHVWLQHQTVYPPGVPPMHGQRQSMFVSRKAFHNPRLRKLSSAFSSTVFMGWLKWMNMDNRPGHVVWHASGVKLASVADLPRDYRARAEREYPQRMSAKPPAG
jgi:hypothetical protein